MKIKEIRKVFMYLAVFVLLLGGGGYAAKRGYVSLRQSRLMNQARAQIQQSNSRKAILYLRRILASDPRNSEAIKLMADLAEQTGSRDSINWRRRVVELSPSSTEAGLALARTALQFDDWITASNALQALPESGRTSPKYHNLAGALATMRGQVTEAEKHFAEASRLEPTNKAPVLKRAVLQIRQTNLQVQAEARAELVRLSADPALNCLALRELVADAGRQGHTNRVLELLNQLVHQTNSDFSDRLLQLEAMREVRHPDYPKLLSDLEADAASNSAKTYQFVTWRMQKTGVNDALRWMSRLPNDRQTNQPVALLMADCRSLLNDWAGLRASLEGQSWGAMDFMRYALLARALRGLDLYSSAKTSWEQALRAAGRQKEKLMELLRLATRWDMAGEQEQLLWTFTSQFPMEKREPEILASLLYRRGRTEGLLSLYSQLAKTSSSDVNIKNNLAMTALLLDAREYKPHQLAREVYELAPTNANVVSTYAFSLYLQKKEAEGLSVMEKLPPSQLENAQFAGYYAMLLQATGDKAKAAKYFEAATNAVLLPEERKLIEQAKQL